MVRVQEGEGLLLGEGSLSLQEEESEYVLNNIQIYYNPITLQTNWETYDRPDIIGNLVKARVYVEFCTEVYTGLKQ